MVVVHGNYNDTHQFVHKEGKRRDYKQRLKILMNKQQLTHQDRKEMWRLTKKLKKNDCFLIEILYSGFLFFHNL